MKADARPKAARPRAGGATTYPAADAILAIDASSSAIGWALFTGGELGPFGVIYSRPAKAPALDRIDRMVASLATIVEAAGPILAVMEISGGKTHGRIAKASGLSTLGHAQGAVRQALRSAGAQVVAVPENEWTGSVPKAVRAERIARAYPEYRDFHAKRLDDGFDAADGIGIGLYYLGKLREQELMRRADPHANVGG